MVRQGMQVGLARAIDHLHTIGAGMCNVETRLTWSRHIHVSVVEAPTLTRWNRDEPPWGERHLRLSGLDELLAVSVKRIVDRELSGELLVVVLVGQLETGRNRFKAPR